MLKEFNLSSKEALFRTSFSKLPATENERLILFTSGTTGISKGVVHSNSSLDHQIKFLVKTWNWCERDKLLISLPLSHVHGLVTGVLSALSVGASVHIQDRFSPASTSSILGSGIFLTSGTILFKKTEWKHIRFSIQLKKIFLCILLSTESSHKLPFISKSFIYI